MDSPCKPRKHSLFVVPVDILEEGKTASPREQSVCRNEEHRFSEGLEPFRLWFCDSDLYHYFTESKVNCIMS